MYRCERCGSDDVDVHSYPQDDGYVITRECLKRGCRSTSSRFYSASAERVAGHVDAPTEAYEQESRR